MSTISDSRPAAQNSGNICQTCDTKLVCTQCTNVTNSELATLKNEMKQLRKQVAYCFLATLVAVTAILFASLSLSSLPFTHTYASPKDCFATGRGLEVAVVGEQAITILHTVDISGKGYNMQMQTVACELVSEPSGKKIDCIVKKTEGNQYEVSYQPINRGRHQLYIKVEGEHIKGSPFNVTVIRNFGDPKKTTSGTFDCITINQQHQTIVAGTYGSISVFDLSLKELRSFGSTGTGSGEFYIPCDLAVDSDGKLLVADCVNDRLQKFNLDGSHITQREMQGISSLEFNYPSGIAIHPKKGMVYVTESGTNRIQILNQNLTFYKIFGTWGSGRGQFHQPEGIAFDSHGNLYVADSKNHRIQVFTEEGEFLRQIGKEGEHEGELKYPSAIAVDSDDLVYVCEQTNQRVSLFTTEGKFLTSIGEKEIPHQRITPIGIAVDHKGIAYVVGWNTAIKVF